MENILKDKTILITGGTGFIGRALIRRLLKEKPHAIRVFSRDEVKHHLTQEEFKDGRIRCLVGDVRDYDRLKRATKGCDIVIHAAAMKRIDMIEYNVEESIKTNILGTINVVNACLENDIEKAVYISSDKACSPVNTYGACKFISERIFIESNFSKGRAKTVFTCVRYGNVLESTGSLIPSIISKIKNNEEITLTDNQMTRFFISSDQAVNLIFKALKHGVGGEIFIPKLECFKVEDVIEVLKESYNCTKETKLAGIRPGEKIHELMVNKQEASRTFEFDDIFVITSEIEKYQRDSKHLYLEGMPLVNFEEYNSKDYVISKEILRDKLREYGIISLN